MFLDLQLILVLIYWNSKGLFAQFSKLMVAFLHSTAVNLKYQFITKNNQKHLNYQSFDIIYSKNYQKINKPIKKQFSLS